MYVASSQQEAQIIEYQTQRKKLLPILATVYAFKFSFTKVWSIYKDVQAQIADGQYDMLPEVCGTHVTPL